MGADIRIVEETKQPLTMNPKKFALWLFMVSIVMIFAALTSAYIVRQDVGNWKYFELPNLFWVNSGVIIVSSLTMHWAYLSAKKDNLESVKIATILTTILGIAFMAGQILAGEALISEKIHFTGGNTSESFVYVLAGLHFFHVLGGVVYLLILLNSALRLRIHSKNLNQIEMCATYWHFLGGLWLYLFLFLLLNR